MKSHLRSLLLPLGLLLVACSSPPSDADARAALRKMMSSVAGESGAAAWDKELQETKVSGCKKAEPQGYLCDVTGGMAMGGGRSMRFVKADSGWVVVD